MTTAPMPRPSRVPLYVVGGIGVVVGALVVGVLWLTIGGSSGVSGSSDKVDAPAKVGDYQRLADVPVSGSANGKAAADRTSAWNARTAQELSDAYGGAGADVETYASADLQTMFTMQFVRADAPKLYVAYQDPKTLAIKAPMQEVRDFGAVQCVVHNQTTPESSPDAVQVIGVECQRTGGGLTVILTNPGGDVGTDPAKAAALVDQAFTGIR